MSKGVTEPSLNKIQELIIASYEKWNQSGKLESGSRKFANVNTISYVMLLKYTNWEKENLYVSSLWTAPGVPWTGSQHWLPAYWCEGQIIYVKRMPSSAY